MQDSSLWLLAYNTYKGGPRGSKQDHPPRGVSHRDALRLMASVGCMCCGKARIRKVRMCRCCAQHCSVQQLRQALRQLL